MKKNRNTGEADWSDQPGAILILGVTRSGHAFRPGDWIDRLAGLYSTFSQDRSFRYSPYVRPVMARGARALLVDVRLRKREPTGFRFLKEFANENNLMIECIPGRAEKT
ncbi:hypothetical protein SKTS_22940 [Sulfurimicrobium lacus]|uniref:DUF3579 domain-containing protein n=1 Tax=Sulfurimicrobium lacus TaxID=2715678 RepID=A0A6F8VCF7_9PROT|nr:DUF3579 domain-containing protein [Sulfurimicrobium lacus]BCB27408.1 hypothetical protein SKTS_22940 [Sulfurimicrobium lacus]